MNSELAVVTNLASQFTAAIRHPRLQNSGITAKPHNLSALEDGAGEPASIPQVCVANVSLPDAAPQLSPIVFTQDL